MRNKLLLAALVVLHLTACDDDKWKGIESPSGTEFNVASGDTVLRVPVRGSSAWDIAGASERWCRVTQARGTTFDTLLFDVSVNIAREKRSLSVLLTSDDGTLHFTLNQAAATADHLFELPVIFHMLHDSPENNVSTGYLMSCLEKTNALYANARGKGVDMGVRFVPARRDPSGRLLDEPGVRRVRREGLPMDAYAFLNNEFGDAGWLWNPREYINVVIFPFTEDLMGIAYSPTMPESTTLPGFKKSDWYANHLPDDYILCIAWNVNRLGFGYYLDNGTLGIESGGYLTLAHELGHYLGLWHPFVGVGNESGDYCDDTPEYDVDKYDVWVVGDWQEDLSGDEFGSLVVNRVALDGTPFVSENFMDYDYGYRWSSTPDQRERVRAVLENGWLIPGPKIDRGHTRSRSANPVKPPRPKPIV